MYYAKFLTYVVSITLCVCLLCSAVFMNVQAEGLICECALEKCECFLQLGDSGGAMRAVIRKLAERGYLNDRRVKTTYTAKVRLAVEELQSDFALSMDGLLNDETLCALLGYIASDEDEKHDSVVWVSSRSGIRYHEKKNCSGMRNPRKMSQKHAQLLQLDPCGICIE